MNVGEALSNPGAQRTFITSVIAGILLAVIFSYLIHTKLSKQLDDRFSIMRQYAHLVIRVGLGVSFLWGAYHGAIFGPEIPLATIPGGLAWQPVLFVVGALLILGLMTRIAAVVAFIAYVCAFSHGGWNGGFYFLNYFNYLGEIIVLFLERGARYSLDELVKWPSHIFHPSFPKWFEKLETYGEKHSFPIIRVSFGIALIFAALSIKIMHPTLSLEVLRQYHLDAKVAFTALFVVFAAGIIEILLGLILLTGIMYRIGMFILVFFVGYSVWFFGEDVWPHAILVGLGIGLFLHGKDEWCLEDGFFSIFWSWTRKFRKSKNPLSPQ